MRPPAISIADPPPPGEPPTREARQDAIRCAAMAESRIGTLSALSIGIGGMVGGGIFAVTGLTVELTRGAAPVAFVVAGTVALLTAFSYWRLSLRYPSDGGTVEFINVAFGPGMLTGALNILLCLSYVILLAIYAYAFGAMARASFRRRTTSSGSTHCSPVSWWYSRSPTGSGQAS